MRRILAAVVLVFGLGLVAVQAPVTASAACHRRCPSPSPSPSPSPTPTPTPTPPPPSPSPSPTATTPADTLTNRPAQGATIAYGSPGTSGAASAYAHPGGLVVAGRDNYADQVFKDVSAGGGTVLLYLDTVVRNNFGRYHSLLYDASSCGAAVPTWGSYSANGTGPLADFRVGGTLQGKLRCVLEAMVAENPHMAGWFADDVGSRSWFPNLNWSTFPEKQAYRDGAVALTQTFRSVADEHGLVFLVNGTWSAGDGGGYPDTAQHGNALADGGFVEHHDGQISYFGPYACSSQWAAQSAVTGGTAFMYAAMATSAGVSEFSNSGCYAFVSQQSDYDVPVPPWGAHPTGLPSKVAR
jgi:hypothetical protein